MAHPVRGASRWDELRRGFHARSPIGSASGRRRAGRAHCAGLGRRQTETAAPQPDPRIGVLEQELRDVELQLAQIKGAHSDQPDTSAALLDLKRSTSDQYADLNSQLGGA